MSLGLVPFGFPTILPIVPTCLRNVLAAVAPCRTHQHSIYLSACLSEQTHQSLLITRSEFFLSTFIWRASYPSLPYPRLERDHAATGKDIIISVEVYQELLSVNSTKWNDHSAVPQTKYCAESDCRWMLNKSKENNKLKRSYNGRPIRSQAINGSKEIKIIKYTIILKLKN